MWTFNWMTIDFVVISSVPDVNVCLDGFMIIKHKPSINRIGVHTQWNKECNSIVEVVDTPLPFHTCICKSSSSPTHRCPLVLYIYPPSFVCWAWGTEVLGTRYLGSKLALQSRDFFLATHIHNSFFCLCAGKNGEYHWLLLPGGMLRKGC